MKTNELREKSMEELNSTLTELLKEQFNLNMKKTMDEGLKPHRFKLLRRNIARIKTILSSKEQQA